MKSFPIALLIIALSIAGCNDNDSAAPDGAEDPDRIPPAPLISYSVVNAFPHDTASFTEGLGFHNGQLFESTGAPEEPSNNGAWIGSIELATGKIKKHVDLGQSVFGEGITFFNGKVYQLTYRDGKGYVYDDKSFKKLGEFLYTGEGWGFTNDGKSLIMSAGTSNLYFIQPDSMKFYKMLAVQDQNGYVNNLNELEFINGFIYANKWLSSEILKIDPVSGRVVGKLDLSKTVNEVKAKYPLSDVLNGIAYDSATKKVYITGKKWPLLYEIRF